MHVSNQPLSPAGHVTVPLNYEHFKPVLYVGGEMTIFTILFRLCIWRGSDQETSLDPN